jgi:hypothetical protein
MIRMGAPDVEAGTPRCGRPPPGLRYPSDLIDAEEGVHCAFDSARAAQRTQAFRSCA